MSGREACQSEIHDLMTNQRADPDRFDPQTLTAYLAIQ
jgi:hypothetical protein